jgi:hypothetical protein
MLALLPLSKAEDERREKILLQRSLILLVWLGLCANIVLFGIMEVGCTDVWGHALHGRIICEKGRFPQFSDYSWVAEDTTPRSIVSLMQLLSYFLVSNFDYTGILILRIVLLFAICYFLLNTLRRQQVPVIVSVLAFLLFLIMGHNRFLPRGDFFNLLFFACYLYILETYARQLTSSKVWLLPLLQAIWGNLHSLAFLGVAVAGVYCMAACAAREWQAGKRLLWVGLCCGLALFANTATYQPLLLVPQMSQAGLFKAAGEYLGITEIGRPVVFTCYIFCVLCIPLLFILCRAFYLWHHMVLFVALAWISWRYFRMIGMLALHCAFLLPSLVSIGIRTYACKWHERVRRPLRLTFLLLLVAGETLLIVALVTQRFTVYCRDWEYCRPYPPSWRLPVEAVRFIQKLDFSGNIYTDYNTGSYVAYRLYPQGKTFVNSLVGLYYDEATYRLYVSIREGKTDPTIVILPYNIEMFVLNHSLRENSFLIRWLYTSPDWLLVYLDASSTVWAHRQSRCVVAHRLLSVPLEQMLPRLGHSAQEWEFLGYFCADIGRNDLANAMFVSALELKPDSVSLLSSLGLLAVQRGEWDTALQFFVRAAERMQDDEVDRENIRHLLQHKIRFTVGNIWHQRALRLVPDIAK